VNITAANLSGSGTITANGGSGEVGGGGGRIAIRYNAMSMDQDNIRAWGGSGSGTGGNGSVFLKQNVQTNGDLIIDNGSGAPAQQTGNRSPIPPGYVLDNIIIQNGANVIADQPVTVTGSVQVLNSSVLTHSASNEPGISITAKRVVIDGSSRIDVSGRGYGAGTTLGGLNGAAAQVAGSYGGYGASSDRGTAYGHPVNPVYLGSGGGAGNCSGGGSGGGRVTIHATDEVAIDGQVLADGQGTTCGAPGSGSGGSVKIETSLLRGLGRISAAGGSGERSGGGGRVAIFYDTLGADNLNGLLNITALGGTAGVPGSPGTVLLKQNGKSYGDLYVDASNNSSLCGMFTPLTVVGFGTITGLTGNTLTTDGTVPMIPNGLVGVEINPNLQQAQTYLVVSNTATTVTVDITSKPSLTGVAAVGNSYAGIYRFDNVHLQRCGSMIAGDQLVVGGTLDIGSGSTLTHYDATPTSVSMVDLTVGTLDIVPGGSINVDARGYLGGSSGGNPAAQGRTVGNVSGSTSYAAGSYGGFGAAVSGGSTNPLYGSLTDPADLGSGGGTGNCYRGGDGGGLVRIRASDVVIDGLISANGEGVGCGAPGSGSGGTVNITAANLSGSGTIMANGGSGEVGGGGGRIAIMYDGQLLIPKNNISASGGTGSNASGSAGTIYPP
jgi:hypothetical protein